MVTKAIQWIFGGSIFVILWLFVVSSRESFGCKRDLKEELVSFSSCHILFLLPIYAVFSFGVISALIVFYRVATFRNCPEAALELKKEIEEAKKDLVARGFRFS